MNSYLLLVLAKIQSELLRVFFWPVAIPLQVPGLCTLKYQHLNSLGSHFSSFPLSLISLLTFLSLPLSSL